MDKYDITLKVVVVGESGVGTTCIIQRYIHNKFNENTESTSSTIYSYKVIDYKKYGRKINFDIWDIPGQELYRSLSSNFCVNASIGILVYSIKDRNSFEEIQNFWYEHLKRLGEENMVFGVAGNKCDLFQHEEISEEEGRKFAKNIGAIFHLTSCKESIGIDELFEECGEKYLENNKIKKLKFNILPLCFKYLSY